MNSAYQGSLSKVWDMCVCVCVCVCVILREAGGMGDIQRFAERGDVLENVKILGSYSGI